MEYQPFVIAFVAGISYFLSLDGDFVFDDTEAILKNNDITSKSWTDLFYHDFWGTKIDSVLSHKSYRPLTILSFKINYILNGQQLSAMQFKLTNTILHLLSCALLWITYKTVLKSVKFEKSFTNVEFLASLLFSTHPVHVEAVSGIVGRADILAAILFFISFLLYDKSMKDSNLSFFYLFLAIMFAGAAMLFKENGITVLGFCIVYEVFVNINTARCDASCKISYFNIKYRKCIKSIMRLLFCFIAIVIYLYLRWRVMSGTKPEFKETDNPAAFANKLFTRVASHKYIYFINALLLVWPYWLCYDWSMGCIPLINQYSDYRILCIMFLYVFGGIFVLRVLKSRKNAQSITILVLSFSLLIIPFLPASNIFYSVGFVVAERILYIPSAGYCLLVAVGFHKILLRIQSIFFKRIMVYMFYFLILIYTLRSAQRSFDWQTEYKLFTSGLLVCPLNAKVHYNVAKVADAKNNVSWAMTEYKEAIRLYPDYYQAMNNYANLLKNQKQFKDAEFYLKKAISLKEDFPAAWMNLGIVLASTKKYAESEQAYNNALRYRRNYPDCHYNLGNLYLELNKTDMAIENWFTAIQLNSKHNSAWTNLLAVLDNTGQIEKALQIIPKALKELPDSPSVIFAVANVYGKINKYNEAEEYFLKAIELFDNRVKPIHYANLGVLYHRWKKYDSAEIMYQKALEIQPTFKSALVNLKNLKRFKMKSKQ